MAGREYLDANVPLLLIASEEASRQCSYKPVVTVKAAIQSKFDMKVLLRLWLSNAPWYFPQIPGTQRMRGRMQGPTHSPYNTYHGWRANSNLQQQEFDLKSPSRYCNVGVWGRRRLEAHEA